MAVGGVDARVEEQLHMQAAPSLHLWAPAAAQACLTVFTWPLPRNVAAVGLKFCLVPMITSRQLPGVRAINDSGHHMPKCRSCNSAILTR